MPANQVSPKQGEPVIDDDLANGPLGKRYCRDVLCCLLFLAFVGGMIGIGIYGYTKGNPTLIGRGYDVDGNMCGYSSGYEDYKYLFFPLPFSSYLDKTVCVKTCPSTAPTSTSTVTVDCHSTSYFTSCTSTNSDEAAVSAAMTGSHTGSEFYVYRTTGFVSRYCLPDLSGLGVTSSDILNSNGASSLEQWVSDIETTWPVIAVSIAVAFVIGFVYMILLRYCSGVLVWTAILAFIVGLAILGWRFYKSANDYEDTTDTTTSSNSSDSNTSSTETQQRVIAYVCWGVAGFTLLAVLCLFSRIRLAIAILKAAADYVKDTPSVFLVPPVTVIVLLIFYAFWSGAAVFLVSSGTATQVSGTPFGTFSFDTQLKRLLIYHLFGLLWVNAFILAGTQFILASSTAIWYFSQGTGQSVPGTIRTSVKRFFRYHFGSIAFGSLILAIVQMVRLILAYMEAQATKMKGKDNRLIKYTLQCLQCYVACFERFIKFLNKNAYIQIALTGKGFCGAAKDAFFLILNNPLRMGVVSSIGSIFVFFGKVFIACITALIAFLVITNWDKYNNSIYSPFIPTLVIFIFAYAVGAVFMTIYGLAADTILACFIVDEQLNKKKNAPPRHCPESLRNFLDNHQKK